MFVDQSDPDVSLIRVGGELAYATAAPLRVEVDRVLADAPHTVVLDFADLHFIDSTGLAVIVHAWRAGQQAGRHDAATAGGPPLPGGHPGHHRRGRAARSAPAGDPPDRDSCPACSGMLTRPPRATRRHRVRSGSTSPSGRDRPRPRRPRAGQGRRPGLAFRTRAETMVECPTSC
ncbi:STAS domain-containing protein [Micromonospora sp. NPDC047467]|uniref:STAS domain-containing protein n=1 Tax=Micromonospora sp. NPDC047467 TaxID=3154814 RepID=UPI003409CE4C